MKALEDRIRDVAHEIWEREGRPEGRAEIHWFLACDLVRTADFEAMLAMEDVSHQAWNAIAAPRAPFPGEGASALRGGPDRATEILLVLQDFSEKNRLGAHLRSQGYVVHDATTSLCAFEQLSRHDLIGTVIAENETPDALMLWDYIQATRPFVEMVRWNSRIGAVRKRSQPPASNATAMRSASRNTTLQGRAG